MEPAMKPPVITEPSRHKPRILFLYGSLRPRSYSRLLAEEAARIIAELGAADVAAKAVS
jgi:arsenical resistance protein ArsH